MTEPGTPGAPKLRVLQVTHRMGIGGLERVVATLARAIDPSRFEVGVLCLREAGPFAQPLIDAGITVKVLERRSPDDADRLAFLRVARFLREWRPHVIHTHNTEPLLDVTAARPMAPPFTLVHTDHARAFPDHWKYMVAERVASLFAYRVVGVSEHSTANLRRYIRVPARKLVTIENGVDPSPFDGGPTVAEARAALGLSGHGPVIGLAARLEEQKGIAYLLDAMPRVIARHPDVTLLIAGNGSLAEALRAQADRLGIAERVRFLGAWHDIPLLVRALDAFLLPSVWEGLPMSLLEAMAGGCAVVATDVGGIPAAIAHGESGWLVPPQDPAAFADGILAVLADEALRRRLGARARADFLARYSAAAMARRYESLYARDAARVSA